MAKYTLGATDLRTPRIIFGSMARGEHDDAARVEVLQCAIENGLTTIDTAPLYDFGQAERQIALATQELPDDAVQIFTKVGLRWDAGDHGDILFEFTDKDGSKRAVRRNSRPESICWEVEQSLERLQLETLDLVQIHQPDEHTPLNETMSALLDLRSAGKLRHIGVSNFSPAQVKTAQQALADVPLASIQNEYSLVRRQIEAQLLPLCIAQNIGVLAYSPLAAGVLTGSRKVQITQPMQQVIDTTLKPLAAEHGVSPAAVALAWVCQQPGVTAAIAGASTTAQVLEQASALDLNLSGQTLKQLTDEFATSPLEYPEFLPKGVYRRARRLMGKTLRKLGLRK
jgi:aryl-alcohol dehydrogenase-like predicted oxidoreductase